ncbi:MAG: NADH:flavin oxidoreductase [Parvibaculaceae bacterium]|nr:NADH:flavin oxidoreductase [Parvibaculaceae bacterium]
MEIPALDALFETHEFGRGTLRNRFVMAPMTRMFSPQGVPTADVCAYYRARARGGAGLIITEGTYINHPAANGEPRIPAFHGARPLEAWKRIVDAVHEEGGMIIPQIWHYGLMRRPGVEPDPSVPGYSAMAIEENGETVVRQMTQQDIDDAVSAYAEAAEAAERLGFDGVELHGAHEYLIDNFLWEKTNRRSDRYGGSIENRTRFAVEVVSAVRRAISRDFPLVLRFSQWKQSDYAARIAATPDELKRILMPIAEAGVDYFDASTRRFWEPAFEGSPLTLAAWTAKITGKPVMTVGSIGVERAFTVQDEGAGVKPSYARLTDLVEGLKRSDFALAGVGRALLSDPDWVNKIRDRRFAEIRPYERAAHETLVV